MSTLFEIPLLAQRQKVQVTLGGNNYILVFNYDNVDQGGWIVDIYDTSNNSVLTGVPLITGADLLAQYSYLGLGGSLWVQSQSDPDAVPTFESLGSDGKLYWQPAS